MKRPHIALLRGPYLGLFEAQNYEPLLDRFDVHAYILPQNRFNLDGCRLPVTICRFPDARWFGGRSLINAWHSRVRGERYPMPAVDEIVAQSQIVHTFEAWYAYTRQAAEACARYGVPLVVTHWDTQPYARSMDARLRRKIARAHSLASRILATTDAARRALLQDGVPDQKIAVQGMGVDADRFSPGPRSTELMNRVGIQGDDFVFAFIGRISRDKGVQELACAFEGLCRRNRTGKLRLLLLGEGPLQQWVQSSAANWGLQDRIILVPTVYYRDLHLWHRLADIFVFPSVPLPRVEEQFGYALVEAMGTGRAIITTTSGGIPDVVGDAARIVPPGDVVALTEAMASLQADNSERERLGNLARMRVLDKFSSRVVSDRLSQIYLELCPS